MRPCMLSQSDLTMFASSVQVDFPTRISRIDQLCSAHYFWFHFNSWVWWPNLINMVRCLLHFVNIFVFNYYLYKAFLKCNTKQPCHGDTRSRYILDLISLWNYVDIIQWWWSCPPRQKRRALYPFNPYRLQPVSDSEDWYQVSTHIF